MPKTVTMTWREYRRLLKATVKPDDYRNRLEMELKASEHKLRATADLYQSTYAAYGELRDKFNGQLMHATPQIEGLQARVRELQTQLVTERNGNAALQTDRNRLGIELEDARRRLAVAGDLDRREITVADAELRVTVAVRLAQDMYDLASSVGRSVRPNRPVAPFPNFEQLVRDAKRAESDGEEID